MTPDEAAGLASRLAATWRGGPTASVWIEELERLDAGTAGTTYARLRREEEHAPSIAKFIAVYRSLNTAATDQPKCGICDSTGWVEGPDLVKGEITYTQVVPCLACEYGAQARRIHPKILDANARTP